MRPWPSVLAEQPLLFLLVLASSIFKVEDCTSSGRILEQLSIDGCSWKVDVSYDTSSDEDILNAGLWCVSTSFPLLTLLCGR